MRNAKTGGSSSRPLPASGQYATEESPKIAAKRRFSGPLAGTIRSNLSTSTTLAEVQFLDSQESLMVIQKVPACGGW